MRGIILGTLGVIVLACAAVQAEETPAETASIQPAAAPKAESAPAAEKSERMTLLLRGGARVTGDLLKEKKDSLLMDLGYGVISIPTVEVVERLNDSGGAISATSAAEGDLYTEASGTADEHPIKELADQIGSSVGVVATPGGLGAGFAVDTKGHFVTNFHVVRGERKITLTLSRGTGGREKVKIENVRILAISPFLDLALLEADMPAGLDIKAIPLSASENLTNGQPVFAIGNPLGLERTVSEGIISTAKRDFEGQLFVQTTAPVNPGNSGGPLLNLRGEVVGVINMKAGWFTEGLNFAIPVDTLKFFLRNRDAFAFDKDNPGTGFHYLPPPRKKDETKSRTEAGQN